MNLHGFPRRGYVTSPTPIEPLPRFSRALGAGIEVFAKRDDLLPGCLGGNKTRKLDFCLGEAMSRGATAVITCGAVQSNHCRLTLAWAIHEGLDCHLVLEERVPGSYLPHGSGNNLVFNLLGANSVTVVPGGAPVQEIMSSLARKIADGGARPYVIPGGAADPLGALGYAACVQEISLQLMDSDPGFRTMVCASGSGGTQAGLLAGLEASSTPLSVVGINVRRPSRADQERLILGLANDALALLGRPRDLDPGKVVCLERFLGPGYSIPDQGTLEAIRLLARTEAILADPVYTGKSLAGLVGLAREGFFEKNEPVLFLHTGGAPAIFGYAGLFGEVPPSLHG
ncbi:MAG: D-cysteine desulfhydrase [Deltaproteobacteria bacterium]|jgi:D-cysteine desulfhydrase|nr:D-cysteine desulfhydrase [Deltaproteobacteria bacterium]